MPYGSGLWDDAMYRTTVPTVRYVRCIVVCTIELSRFHKNVIKNAGCLPGSAGKTTSGLFPSDPPWKLVSMDISLSAISRNLDKLKFAGNSDHFVKYEAEIWSTPKSPPKK